VICSVKENEERVFGVMLGVCMSCVRMTRAFDGILTYCPVLWTLPKGEDALKQVFESILRIYRVAALCDVSRHGFFLSLAYGEAYLEGKH